MASKCDSYLLPNKKEASSILITCVAAGSAADEVEDYQCRATSI